MNPRNRIEEAFIRRAETLLTKMRQTAESSDPDRIEAESGLMMNLLGLREFPSSLRTQYRDATKRLELQAHERAVELGLQEAEHRARAGDRDGRDRSLAKVKDQLSKALRAGAPSSRRKEVEQRRRLIADLTIHTPRRRRLRKRATNAAPPDGVENRRTVRYAEPVLTVDIGRAQFTTIDWSINGLLLNLGDQGAAFQVGAEVRAEVSCHGVEMRHRQSARVVRVDLLRRIVALAFLESDPVILAFLTALDESERAHQPETG